MSSVAERSLALNRALIGASVRVPARFFGVAFAKTALDKDGGDIEYTYTITGFREPGNKVTAEWTLAAPDEEDVFVNMLWMRKFKDEGRILGGYTLCFRILWWCLLICLEFIRFIAGFQKPGTLSVFVPVRVEPLALSEGLSEGKGDMPDDEDAPLLPFTKKRGRPARIVPPPQTSEESDCDDSSSSDSGSSKISFSSSEEDADFSAEQGKLKKAPKKPANKKSGPKKKFRWL